MTLILWLSVLWIVPLIAVMLANEAAFKKNIAVGVTLPHEARGDEEVTACLRKFKKRLMVLSGLLVAVAVPCMFVKDIGAAMTLWLIWLDLSVILPYIPYVLCNRQLKVVKARRGWRRETAAVVTVDTAHIQPQRWLSLWWFVPALVVSVLPLLWERSLWPLYAVDAVCVVSFWFCYRYAYRNKAERVDDNRELTAVLTRVRRRCWSRMWVVTAWFMPLMGLGLSLTVHRPGWTLGIAALLSGILVCYLLYTEFSLRKTQEKLTAWSGQDWYVDEDDCWIGGLLYYNPRDNRLIINNRVGMNTSVNLAKRSGQVLMGLVALLLLLLPFTGAIVDCGGGRPMELTLTETTLTAAHGGREYEVAREDILSVEQLEELPHGLRRTVGTGLPTLLKGSFTAPGLGALNVCLDPGCPPFLLVEEKGGTRYLLGSRDSAWTESLADELTE